jgi:hypothetical protein
MFNEPFISYDDGNFQSQIATFVHEVLHALWFHPALFERFPNNSSGDSFLFQDSDGKHKLRGDNILEQVKEHFNCSTVKGGKPLVLKFYNFF